MKGVILAGGSGSRLHPLTLVTNKHLLPVYDKPMIWWPLSYLINAKIRDIFIVTGGEHFSAIGGLLGSGDEDEMAGIGLRGPVSLAYGVQKKPRGIAHALALAQEFSPISPVAVVLGDNIFEDRNFLCEPSKQFPGGAHIFLKEVPDQYLYEIVGGKRRAKYGIAEVKDGKVVSIEEKPENPKSNLAVTGAYIYDQRVFMITKGLKPSWRGELEITDVNNRFISEGQMTYTLVQGHWTDAGSVETLKRASDLAEQWARLQEMD